MQMIYSSESFILVYLLLNPPQSLQLFGSFTLQVFLCLFIILITVWHRDFWRSLIPNKIQQMLFFNNDLAAQNREQPTYRIPEAKSLEAFWVPSSEQPSFADMAKLLVNGLPPNDRAEAYTLLVTQLLPQKWARRPTFLERREQVERIYQRLADGLQKVAPNQRLKLLRSDLFRHEIKELIRNSFTLAVARYLKEHPEATNRVRKNDRDRASQWQALSISELEDKASQLYSEVEKWEKLVEAKYPDLWDEYKLNSFSAQLDLNSAYSGSFHVAMGDFAIFLRRVGASFEELRLH